MNQFLADVALPVPLGQSFTYIIPPEFAPVIQTGSRVLVPFGRKRLTGIVVGLPSTTTVQSLKPVLDVLDIAPVVSAELLRLGRWIADYYVAPLGEVLKAFLPQGISVENKVTVSLKLPLDQAAVAHFDTSAPQRAKVIKVLRAGKDFSIEQLRKRAEVKGIYPILMDLLKAGLIEITDRVPTGRSRPRIEKFVLKKNDAGTLVLRGETQQRLLIRVRQLTGEPYSLRLLLKEAGASHSSLKKLLEIGAIEIVEREVARKIEFETDPGVSQISSLQLTKDQVRVLREINASIRSGIHKTYLLHGITGSGKTQVYIEAIREVLEAGKTAIVLVPEISLTPQIVRRFRMHFGEAVAVMHSRMSDGERYDAWRFCREGKYKIVIGPRSAIFAPLENLGLIVVDEEHEASYKQFETTPRYNARDVAVVRGQQTNTVVVLGSATPSIESYYNAQSGKYALLELPERIDDAVLPSISLVNMADEHKRRYAAMKVEAAKIGRKAFEGGFHSISLLLEQKIHDRLQKKEGIILLQNRRGFAPFIECVECGNVERCDRCDVTLTYHLVKKHLRCHYCGFVKPVPRVCAKCGSSGLKLQGFGTQRVEQDVARIFPEARVLRMDLDTTTRKGAHDKLLQQFARGEADILLGTQMVAKGLDFPRVTLVGVISADTQMLLPDFRSAERTFQLLTQVAGRAGRSSLRGEVIIQSYQTEHYGLKHVLDHNYRAFYEEELQYRKSALYVPFARLILVELRGSGEKKVEATAEEFYRRFRRSSPATVLLGPAPAVISKIKDNYRWHIIIKAVKANDPNSALVRRAVTRVVHELSSSSVYAGVRITVDVDPQGIL